MKVFQSKCDTLPGTSYQEVMKAARQEYHAIQKLTPRRQPYIRSAYFRKDKIFVNQFWVHLNQKVPADRLRRLKFFACGMDVIRNCKLTPDTMQNPGNKDQTLHRFTAMTRDGKLFYVQIREDKQTGRKDYMSAFPANDKLK